MTIKEYNEKNEIFSRFVFAREDCLRKLLIICLLFIAVINLNSIYVQKTKAGFTKWISENGQPPLWTIFGRILVRF
jgi:hypothetical protein